MVFINNNPALKGFLISLSAVLISFGIYFLFLAKKNDYLLDNPTPESYYFQINNGPQSKIAGGQFLQVPLKKGKNSIKVYDASKNLLYDSAFQVNKQRGLINITHKDYYINRQFYGYNLKKDSLLLKLGKIVIDGKDYFGGAEHFNKLYTDDFYYNIDENYDKIIKNIDKVESRTKIFRKQDFLNYYKEYYQF